MPAETNATHTPSNAQSAIPTPPAHPAPPHAAHGLSREFHDVLSDIEDLITSTTSLTGDDLARAKMKLRSRISDARRSLSAMGSGVVEQARTTADRTHRFVQHQPWQAVGIGAGIGLLIGMLIGRRGSGA